MTIPLIRSQKPAIDIYIPDDIDTYPSGEDREILKERVDGILRGLSED